MTPILIPLNIEHCTFQNNSNLPLLSSIETPVPWPPSLHSKTVLDRVKGFSSTSSTSIHTSAAIGKAPEFFARVLNALRQRDRAQLDQTKIAYVCRSERHLYKLPTTSTTSSSCVIQTIFLPHPLSSISPGLPFLWSLMDGVLAFRSVFSLECLLS